jgi:hypothetical protein
MKATLLEREGDILMQESHDVIWRFFQATGHIGAYLFYRTIIIDEYEGVDVGEEMDLYS